MGSLNFITDGTIERVCARRSHREECLRECFRYDIERAFNHAESALDHCRDMARAGFDATEELKDAETLLNAWLLAILLLQHKHESQRETEQ